MITFEQIKNFRIEAKSKRKSNRDLLKKSIVDFFQIYKTGLGLQQETFSDGEKDYPYVVLVDSDGKQKDADSIIVDSSIKARFQLYTVVDDSPSHTAAESVNVSIFYLNTELCYKISGLSQPEKTFSNIISDENLIEISEFIKQSLLDKMASDYGLLKKPVSETVNLWD
ncbi:hypothetical protein [Pantoea agglomerans]|uniref:hypothetical protein n=1 Tax=Enterobacter agglomerans TaxID=549 RepID=UPI00320A7549